MNNKIKKELLELASKKKWNLSKNIKNQTNRFIKSLKKKCEKKKKDNKVKKKKSKKKSNK